MLLSCTTKGCYAQDHHPLDTETNKVMCLHCGGEINVPKPTITTLQSLRQVKRKVKSGIMTTCKNCGNEDNPTLKKLSGQVSVAICKKCEHKLDIHPSFVEAMKSLGGYEEGKTAEDRKLVTAPQSAKPKKGADEE